MLKKYREVIKGIAKYYGVTEDVALCMFEANAEKLNCENLYLSANEGFVDYDEIEKEWSMLSIVEKREQHIAYVDMVNRELGHKRLW